MDQSSFFLGTRCMIIATSFLQISLFQLLHVSPETAPHPQTLTAEVGMAPGLCCLLHSSPCFPIPVTGGHRQSLVGMLSSVVTPHRAISASDAFGNKEQMAMPTSQAWDRLGQCIGAPATQGPDHCAVRSKLLYVWGCSAAAWLGSASGLFLSIALCGSASPKGNFRVFMCPWVFWS